MNVRLTTVQTVFSKVPVFHHGMRRLTGMDHVAIVPFMGLSPRQIEQAEQVRQGLLQAAARIVIEKGVQNLTLAAVAARARVSKGGLLHHFASKADLLHALAESLMAELEQDLNHYADADPDPYGRRIRAYVRANLCHETASNEIVIALFPLALSDPDLVALVREGCDAWLNSTEAGDTIDPIQSHFIRLTTEGFWIADMMKLHPEPPSVREEVLNRLIAMTYPAA